MENKNVVLILLLALFFARPAIALDVQGYEELKTKSRASMLFHINGVGDGYAWSNVILENRGSPPLYCPPRKMTLNADNYMAILDAKIAEYKESKTPEVPVELILFYGLVDSFPCSK